MKCFLIRRNLPFIHTSLIENRWTSQSCAVSKNTDIFLLTT